MRAWFAQRAHPETTLSNGAFLLTVVTPLPVFVLVVLLEWWRG
jgi:hypothetical protein